MADELPGQLDRDRHIELEGRGHQPWTRRVVIGALLVVVVLALGGTFGQEPSRSSAAAPDADVTVRAPKHLRGGLFYQGRIDITARTRLAVPTVALAAGWTEQMQLNTIEPAPTAERSRHGELLLSFAPLPAGEQLTVWLQFEVNPTNSSGRRDQTVRVLDGRRTLVALPRKVTVYP